MLQTLQNNEKKPTGWSAAFRLTMFMMTVTCMSDDRGRLRRIPRRPLNKRPLKRLTDDGAIRNDICSSDTVEP